MDKRYQVFVSSTFTDLEEERKAIIQGLLNAKYIPAGMEMFAASNDEQFKYIKKIIDTCDYYVLIIGGRYGSINSSTGKSFTEQEYDYAVEKGIPVLAFLHDAPDNLPVEKRDDKNRELLEKFRSKVSDGRLCKMWHTSSELISSVIISLIEEVANNPQMGWTRGNIEDSVELLSQINELRKEKENIERKYKEIKRKYDELTRETDNIAFGDDVFTIRGTLTGFDDRRKHYSKDIEIVLTWNEIFSAVAPYLTAPTNFDGFCRKLIEAINYAYNANISYINHDCAQTVKVQLSALGLIKYYQANLIKGGVAEGIVITEKGSRYLVELKTEKNKLIIYQPSN
ncbi:MAG: DUF4062 domain-containing protein [Dorea sp.]|nr:DUF4062 domain-containing protein [Dorea sp.]